MTGVELDVKPRESRTKGYLNRIRSEGFVPGVVYGKQLDGIGVEFEGRALETILKQHGRNTILNMRIQSNGKKARKYTVLIKDVQYTVMKNKIQHVDFQQISLKDEISTTVNLHLIGEAPGTTAGGNLSQPLRQLEISCLATAIPDSITVDISGLDIGDNIHVSDLHVPEGVKVLSEPDTLVVSITAPRRTEEAEKPEVAEEPAEAEAKGEKQANE
jgi:large subunit ribosomal protein L25